MCCWVCLPLGINQTKVDEQWPDKSWSTSGCSWEEEWGKNRLYLWTIAMEAMAHRNTNGLPIKHGDFPWLC